MADIGVSVNGRDFDVCTAVCYTETMCAYLNCHNDKTRIVSDLNMDTSKKHPTMNIYDAKFIFPVTGLNSEGIMIISKFILKKKACKSFVMLVMNLCVTMIIENR